MLVYTKCDKKAVDTSKAARNERGVEVHDLRSSSDQFEDTEWY